jgi:hypothetical protein
MALGGRSLSFKGFLVFEGMERVARTVPIDDSEADGPDNLERKLRRAQRRSGRDRLQAWS